jgi:CRISPR-associated protein Csm4
MQAEAIKLRFISPLHLGRGLETDYGKTETVLHSDTLKSALFALGIQLFPEWEKTPALFFDAFSISSCFPFAGSEYFFPKPFLKRKLEFSASNEHLQAKKSKRVDFLSKTIFEKFIKQEALQVDENCLSPDGSFVFEKNGNVRIIFKTEVQQRVAVPAESGQETKPYYVDRLFFNEDCGLFFLAQFHTETIKNQVIAALKLLGDQGIGTDKSVGNGQFIFDQRKDIENISIETGTSLKHWISLGLYLPEKSEFEKFDLNSSTWQLIKRGGYMGGSSDFSFLGIRKKNIFMFSEASVFASDESPVGKLIDLKPDWDAPMHPVWRDGRPLFLAV